MRAAQDDEGVEEGAPHRKGIYVGAYGWLENVRPANKTLTPVKLEGELDEIFNKKTPGGVPLPPIVRDDHEPGIHPRAVGESRRHGRGAAQRLRRQRHARAAGSAQGESVLRARAPRPQDHRRNPRRPESRRAAGLRIRARPARPLRRWRSATSFIYPLRLVFPLYTTPPEDLPEGTSIQSIEARNVVNGLKLLRHVRGAAPANEPIPSAFRIRKLPDASNAEQRRHQRRSRSAARPLRRGRGPRRRRGRAPGRHGQLRSRGGDARRLWPGDVPADSGCRADAAQRHRADASRGPAVRRECDERRDATIRA